MIGNFIGAPIGGVMSAGELGNTGVLAVTLDDVTLIATGTLALAGQANVTLDDVALTATGTLALSGSAAIVLDDATLEATAVTEIHGNLGTVLGDVTLVATGIYEPINITFPPARSTLITTAMTKNQSITTARPREFQITA